MGGRRPGEEEPATLAGYAFAAILVALVGAVAAISLDQEARQTKAAGGAMSAVRHKEAPPR